jgi:ATP-dependent RNA helicase DDX51/DBP6
MRNRLEELGIIELFAGTSFVLYTAHLATPNPPHTVQTALIPHLLLSRPESNLYRPYDPPRDLCVSAPTGSGKTLAYVLPIIEVPNP